MMTDEQIETCQGTVRWMTSESHPQAFQNIGEAIRAALATIEEQKATIATLDLALRDRDEELAKRTKQVAGLLAKSIRDTAELALLRRIADDYPGWLCHPRPEMLVEYRAKYGGKG